MLSGTNLVPLRYCTSSFTASSNFGNGRKSNPRDFNSAVASDLRLSVQRQRPISGAVPKILLNYATGIVVRKRQHATPSMLDKDNFLGSKKLLRDDDAS